MKARFWLALDEVMGIRFAVLIFWSFSGMAYTNLIAGQKSGITELIFALTAFVCILRKPKNHLPTIGGGDE